MVETMRLKYEEGLRRVNTILQLGRDGVNLVSEGGGALAIKDVAAFALARVRGAEAVQGDEFITKSQLDEHRAQTSLTFFTSDQWVQKGNEFDFTIAVGSTPFSILVYESTNAGYSEVMVNKLYKSNGELVLTSFSAFPGSIAIIK